MCRRCRSLTLLAPWDLTPLAPWHPQPPSPPPPHPPTHPPTPRAGMDPSSPSFGTKDGSCGYGAISREHFPYFSTAALAPSNRFYAADTLHGCGQCFQVQCADSRDGG